MITRCKVETKLERPGLNNGFMHKGSNKVNKPLKEGEQLTKKLTRPKNSKNRRRKRQTFRNLKGVEKFCCMDIMHLGFLQQRGMT